MLEKQELKMLNDQMLNLGAPIDKDDTGYNIPDFSRMSGLSYIPHSEYTDLMCFAMLDTLRHYENTQLSAYKDKIEETYAYYDRMVTLDKKKQYIENPLFFKEANLDYLPPQERERILHKDKLPITYVKTYTSANLNDYFVLTFANSKKANQFKNQIQTEDAKKRQDPRCYFRNIGTWEDPKFQFYIKPEILPDFIIMMSYRFYPDDRLTQFLAEMEAGTFEVKHDKIPIEVVSYKIESDDYELHTDAYIADLKNFVNHNKPLIRWKKTDNGKFNLVVAGERIPNYLEFMKNPKYNIDTEKLSALYKDNEKNKATKNTNHIYVDFSGDQRIILDRNMELLNALQNNTYFKKAPSTTDKTTIHLSNKEFKKLPEIFEEISRKTGLEFEISKDLQDHIDKIRVRNNSAYQMIDANKLALPFKPYDFQLEDIQAIGSKKRMLIGHDVGCGKTFISTLVGMSINEPKLVIVPESLRLNWEREIKRVTPDADVKVLYSKDMFEVGKDWTIVGYSTASKFCNELLAEQFNCVFVDEAHKCKAVNNKGEPSSERAKAVMKLTTQAEYCYLLTGTPIPTSNKDLYNILKMLQVDDIDFGEEYAFFNFGKEYCNATQNHYGWDFNGNSNGEALHEILAPYMVRRLKKDVLPNIVKQRTFVPLLINNPKIKDIETRLKTPNDHDTFMGLAMTGRRLMSEYKLHDCKELCDTLLEAEESVVVVSEFKETIDKIAEYYKDDCCSIVGGMSDVAKQQAIDDFQSGKKHVCAVNTIAGGVGITLTKASNMIISDFNWTPANMIQVEGRICRSGQKNPCNIYYLYGDDCILDKYFVEMITDKNGNINLVVDNAENDMNLTADREENTSFLDYLKKKLQFSVPCNIQPENNSDIKKITMLSKCNHLETFDEDVKKFTKSLKREKTIAEWNKLIALRRKELEEYEKNK